MKIKLAVFDMDGTILNTIDDLADSCNYVLEKNGYPVHTNDEIRYMVGNGIPKLIERALPKGTDLCDFERVLSEFISWYEEHCSIKTAPYEGMVNCLKELKSSGIKIAVDTNKLQEAADSLCTKYFNGLFDVVIGSRKGLPPKPAPDGVQMILEQLKISEKETVFIGDSDVDVQTGLNAGARMIGVDWGFRGGDFLKAHGAEHVAYDCQQLVKMIKSFQQDKM